MDNVIAFPTKQVVPSEPSFIQALCTTVDWVIEQELPDVLSSVLLAMTNDPIRTELMECDITDVEFSYIPPHEGSNGLHLFTVGSTVRTNMRPHYAVQMFKDFISFNWMDTQDFPETAVLGEGINWVAEFVRIFSIYAKSFPEFVSGNAMMLCLKFLQTLSERPEIQCIYGVRSERHKGSILEFGFYEKLEDGKGRIYTLFIDFLPFVLDDSALKLSEEMGNN